MNDSVAIVNWFSRRRREVGAHAQRASDSLLIEEEFGSEDERHRTAATLGSTHLGEVWRAMASSAITIALDRRLIPLRIRRAQSALAGVRSF